MDAKSEMRDSHIEKPLTGRQIGPNLRCFLPSARHAATKVSALAPPAAQAFLRLTPEDHLPFTFRVLDYLRVEIFSRKARIQPLIRALEIGNQARPSDLVQVLAGLLKIIHVVEHLARSHQVKPGIGLCGAAIEIADCE